MCRSLERPARRHAAALAAGGSDAAVVTGDTLISGLGAACAWEMPE